MGREVVLVALPIVLILRVGSLVGVRGLTTFLLRLVGLGSSHLTVLRFLVRISH